MSLLEPNLVESGIEASGKYKIKKKIRKQLRQNYKINLISYPMKSKWRHPGETPSEQRKESLTLKRVEHQQSRECTVYRATWVYLQDKTQGVVKMTALLKKRALAEFSHVITVSTNTANLILYLNTPQTVHGKITMEISERYSR